jgi:hypothetical protein
MSGQICAECREGDGELLEYHIAWPAPIRRYWTGFLHRECETVFVARREQAHNQLDAERR